MSFRPSSTVVSPPSSKLKDVLLAGERQRSALNAEYEGGRDAAVIPIAGLLDDLPKEIADDILKRAKTCIPESKFKVKWVKENEIFNVEVWGTVSEMITRSIRERLEVYIPKGFPASYEKYRPARFWKLQLAMNDEIIKIDSDKFYDIARKVTQEMALANGFTIEPSESKNMSVGIFSYFKYTIEFTVCRRRVVGVPSLKFKDINTEP